MMTRKKQMVPSMLDNIWRILEKPTVTMGSFALNHGPENYNWTLFDAPEEASAEMLMAADLIPRPRMPHKLDGLCH